MKNSMIFISSIIFSMVAYGQNLIQKQPLTVDQIWGSGKFYEKQPQTIVPLKKENYTYLTLENTEINKYFINGHSVQKQGAIVAATSLGIETIEDYILSPDEQQLIIVTNSQSIFRHSYTSDIFYYDIEKKKGFEIAPQHKGKRDFSFSPNGKFIIYSHLNNLYKFDLSTQKSTALTTNGKSNEIINGTADWVYEEEFSRTKFYDISYDGRYLAYVSFEQFDVPPTILNYYAGNTYPDYEVLKYPKAGEKNSVVRLHLIDLSKNKQSNVNLGDYEYIPRINFSDKDDYLVVQTLNRKQDFLQFQKVSCSNGKYNTSILYQEKDSRYIEIEDNIYFEPNQNSFLTLSDKNGFKHIYRIHSDGKTEQLTKGNYDVQEIHGFDGEGDILFTAAYSSPINSSVCVISPEGEGFKVVSEYADKHYGISAYTSGNSYYYGYYTSANEPKTIGFFNFGNGGIFHIQENNQQLKTELEAYNLSPKIFTKIKGVSDSLNVSIIKPSNFDPAKKYPVYFHVYCGPGSNTVINRYGGPEYMYHQLLAQNGYFVVSVDTRGTLYRGADFKKLTYGQLGKLELEDLTAVAGELSKLSYIDKDRIGIQGWSYGGFMASLAITKGADIFKTAIAVAPVTQWSYYDNVYTERYMNLPENNPDGYKENSPVYYAGKLKGAFLLIHGDADDNVHIQNSMELAKTLINANKDFDYFVYPNKNHGIGGVRKHLFNKMLKFTLSNL